MATNIDHILHENRLFAPSKAFQEEARINSQEEYDKLYQESIKNPEKFWSAVAENFHWFKKWDQVLDWSNPPFAKWFVNGKTNIAYNCLDRNINNGHGGKVALYWEGEPEGESKEVTYNQLHHNVCVFANGLKKLGVTKGDTVALYMPMIPELAVAMLACARIGAIHSIIFAGFSANAIAERVNDAKCKLVITSDGAYRRGKVLDLKSIVDEAMESVDCVQNVIVYKRCNNTVKQQALDLDWQQVIEGQSANCPAEEMDAEDPLFILYTSGSTGKPKGIQHSTAGYMIGSYLSTKYIFDANPRDIYWCTADIGWITGHSYVVYGPMNNTLSQVMYEGAPNYPDEARFWKIIEKYKVSIFYTAPTAIRAFMKWGEEYPKEHDLSSLRLLGSVGEPINPEAWLWYHTVIGKEKCPIVDTWWQTETGSIMMSPMPGITSTKPGSCTRPFFGVVPAIVDEDGKELGDNEGGFLVLKQPWPSMLRNLWGDEARFKQVYWEKFSRHNWYLAGDGAVRDSDGYYWILGRIDDVINVSGHRLSTMEVESALVAHDYVVEAAVVGFKHDIKGEGIAAFVTLASNILVNVDTEKELKLHVRKMIGAIAEPDQINFTEALPKTRSGKIMRRLLKSIANGEEITGDTTTLEDKNTISALQQNA